MCSSGERRILGVSSVSRGFRSLAGPNASWHGGKRLAVAIKQDKVFAQAPMPETVHRTLDAIVERNDFLLPRGDLSYTPAIFASTRRAPIVFVTNVFPLTYIGIVIRS